MQEAQFAVDSAGLDLLQALLDVLLHLRTGQLRSFDVAQGRVDDRLDLQSCDVGLGYAADVVVLQQELEEIANSRSIRRQVFAGGESALATV